MCEYFDLSRWRLQIFFFYWHDWNFMHGSSFSPLTLLRKSLPHIVQRLPEGARPERRICRVMTSVCVTPWQFFCLWGLLGLVVKDIVCSSIHHHYKVTNGKKEKKRRRSKRTETILFLIIKTFLDLCFHGSWCSLNVTLAYIHKLLWIYLQK